jgi:hypothetical protein
VAWYSLTDKGLVGVVQGFRIVPTNAASNPIQGLARLRDFLRVYLTSGAIFGKGGAEVEDILDLMIARLFSWRWGIWNQNLELIAPA